jgi:tetratricopeptide (TPR) repeat protein
MKIKIFLILLLLTSFNSIACLNGETKVLKNGAFIYEDYQGIIPHGHDFYVENYPKLIKELDSLYKATKDVDYLSDKGYILIIQKKYSEALSIYFKIEQLKPNRYSTASNIGTIYELLGDNKKALLWINRALQINSKSHNGSEWLHIKILQAKIGGEKYISSNFLINTDFGENNEPKSKMSKSDMETLIKSLYYQLNERISFIKSEDKIIGLLLFELGNLAVLDKKYDEAIYIYEKAGDYGFKNEILNRRIDYANWKVNDKFYSQINNLNAINEYHKKLFVITFITASLVIIILLVIIFRLRKNKKI